MVVTDADGAVQTTLHWGHAKESPEFISVLLTLGDAGAVIEIVMEPSSAYGDACALRCLKLGSPSSESTRSARATPPRFTTVFRVFMMRSPPPS